MHYTFIQLLFFFYFYCIVGWIWETSYVSVREKHFVNRGFMKGPMIPIYGTGAVLMLVVTLPFRSNLILMFLAGSISATLMELLTGMTMEAIFKVRYWDYSEVKLNFKGYISLWSSLLWGVFTLGLVEIIHKPVDSLMHMIAVKYLNLIVMLISLIFVSDLMSSVKTALDIRDILVKLEAVKDEVGRYQKRLDVILAFAESDIQNIRDERSERIGDTIESLERRVAAARGKFDIGNIGDDIREEIGDIRVKLGELKGKLSFITGWKDYMRRQMFRGNPYMKSGKYGEVLSELKDMVSKRNK